MASGEQATREAVPTDTSSVRDRLDPDAYTTVMALPTAEHVVAAVALARLAEPMVRIRLLDGSNAVPSSPTGPVLGTHPSIPGIDAALEPGDPIAAVSALGGSTSLASLAGLAVADADGAGPGIASAFDAIDRSITSSIRWYGPLSGVDAGNVRDRLEKAALPTTVEQLRSDPREARRLASWLVSTALESADRPPSVAAALERLCSPTYTGGGRVPTVEGAHDVLDVLSLGDPGLALAACIDDGHLDAALGRYEGLAGAIHDEVASLPVDRDGPVATATLDSSLLEPTAWLWTAFRLRQDYGLLVGASTSTRIAFASSGDRAASAVLEAVTTTTGGVHWGDEHVAGARIDEARDDLVEIVTDQL